MSEIKDMLNDRIKGKPEKAEPPKVMRKIKKAERKVMLMALFTNVLTALVDKSDTTPRKVGGLDAWTTIEAAVRYFEVLEIQATKRTVGAALKDLVADGSVERETFSRGWRLPAIEIYKKVIEARESSHKALKAYQKETTEAWDRVVSTVPFKPAGWRDQPYRDLPNEESVRGVEISYKDLRRVMKMAFPEGVPADWDVDLPK